MATKFIKLTAEGGGAMILNVEHIVGIVEHDGRVYIRTIDDKGADRVMNTIGEIEEVLAAAVK